MDSLHVRYIVDALLLIVIVNYHESISFDVCGEFLYVFYSPQDVPRLGDIK